MQHHHINIKAKMPLLEKEKDFFCEVLGLKEGFRPNFNKKGFWLYSADNNPIIHLTEEDGEEGMQKGVQEGSPRQGYIDHIAFQSSHVNNFIARLNNLNIAYRTSYLAEINVLQVLLHSPLGIKIEVVFNNENIE